MKKKERLQYKDASDVFIKDNVKGMDKLGGKGHAKLPQTSKRSLKLNTNDTLSKYAGSFADKAASPQAKSNPDSGLNADSMKSNVRSTGLNQSKNKRKK
jgi:hypothetical protein